MFVRHRSQSVTKVNLSGPVPIADTVTITEGMALTIDPADGTVIAMVPGGVFFGVAPFIPAGSLVGDSGGTVLIDFEKEQEAEYRTTQGALADADTQIGMELSLNADSLHVAAPASAADFVITDRVTINGVAFLVVKPLNRSTF
jgi:hypothetical protein